MWLSIFKKFSQVSVVAHGPLALCLNSNEKGILKHTL